MGRVTRAVDHLQVEEIDERIKHTTEAWRMRRWQAIRCALVNLRIPLQTDHRFHAKLITRSTAK
jgi:hypothetical protein